jgi:hypothetical protein
MTRALLQQALMALEIGDSFNPGEARSILRKVLAKPEQEPKPLPGADWTIDIRRRMNGGCSKRKCVCKAEDAPNCIWWDEPGDIPQSVQPAQEPLTLEEIRGLLTSAGYDKSPAQAHVDFVNGLRRGEEAHGIGGKA